MPVRIGCNALGFMTLSPVHWIPVACDRDLRANPLARLESTFSLCRKRMAKSLIFLVFSMVRQNAAYFY